MSVQDANRPIRMISGLRDEIIERNAKSCGWKHLKHIVKYCTRFGTGD
jgi:hypothetical protein